MSLNRWRNNYVDAMGVNIPSVEAGEVRYISNVGYRVSGTGTRLNPFGITSANTIINNQRGVLSSGYLSYIGSTTSYSTGYATITGAGMYNTIVGRLQYVNAVGPAGQGGSNYTYLKDFTINEIISAVNNGAPNLRIVQCRINCDLLRNITAINRSIFTFKPQHNTSFSSINNVFLGLKEFSFTPISNACNLSITEGCEVILSKTDIETTFKNYSMAFSNCKFKIANEAAYTALTGTTEAQLRANFAARCEAQGIVVPTFTEYGETNLKMGRWVFSNNSILDGLVKTGSEVAVFAEKRGIYFGYSSKTVTNLPITTDFNVPNSFARQNPTGGNITIYPTSEGGGIHLTEDFDPTRTELAYLWSKPFWLGGKKQLNDLFISNNLNQKLGINIDSTSNLKPPITVSAGNQLLDDGVNYVVRSSDGNFASFQIGTQVYSTSLNTRFNVIRGQATALNITNIVGKPVLLATNDFSSNQTIIMRIVSEIPTQIITSGTLQEDYWYLVEPNNPNDLTGTVTQAGVVRPVYDSFRAIDGQLTFTIQGACHLRRMWRQDYTEASEVTDSAFWATRQKPKKFDVNVNDMRCMLMNNSASSVEMKKDAQGEYIASGHPDFYFLTSGDTGSLLPSFPIQGVYVQFGIQITSLNPM